MRTVLILAAALTMPAVSLAQPSAPPDDCALQPLVRVQESHGVYSVTARFHVAQPASIALAVLTDYERIPQFMPGVESSVVVERGDGRAVINQEAVSRLMMFKKRVQLQLEIVEGRDTLQFRDRSGRSFAVYEGAWRVRDMDRGTEISYELTAKPAFDVPEFILKKLLKRDSGQMIEGLRREIDSRARRADHF